MTPRVVLVHSSRPVIDLRKRGRPLAAHCFGPFSSHEAAEEFEAQQPDNCFKFTLEIVGPDPEDVALGAALVPEGVVH